MEVSEDARFLINTSYQAYVRIDVNDTDTLYFNILVAIFFLGMYLEESIDHIIEQMDGKYEEMKVYLKPHPPGLLNEFVWYYNEFIAEKNGEPKEVKGDIYFNKNLPETIGKLEKEFEGFTTIYQFRNDIAHTKLNDAINRIKSEYVDIANVDALRTCAKKITDKLVNIAQDAGYKFIKKDKAFPAAIGPMTRAEPSSSDIFTE